MVMSVAFKRKDKDYLLGNASNIAHAMAVNQRNVCNGEIMRVRATR